MGIDITAYVEAASASDSEASYFTFAEVWLPRIRTLFTAMGSYGTKDALFPARGLPPNCGWAANDAFHLWVVDPEDEAEWQGEEYIDRESADEAVSQGDATYVDEDRGRITNPGYFSPSWLTRTEIIAALAHAGFESDACPMEFQALLPYMEQLEKTSRVRLVFWFDA